MIYFTTFIFTLLLSHIARAVPACDDAASPEDLYDLTNDDFQLPLLTTYKVTWDGTYNNPNGNTNGVACSDGPYGLASTYPQFHNFPNFPNLGGAFDTRHGSSNCGKCWRLSSTQTGRWIYLTAIDAAGTGFNIAKDAFLALGGSMDTGSLEAYADPVPPSLCGFL